MEVRDAETGEWLVLASPNAKPQAFALHAAAPSPSPGKRPRLGASSSSSSLLPPLAHSPSRKVVHPGVQAASNNAHTERVFVFPETLSTRPMGAKVNWQHDQEMRVERAEHRFQTSLRGLRAELQRKDIDPKTRQATEIRILEKMKAQYAEQVRKMVVEEMAREVAREVEVRLELSAIGKERLRKKHERDRAFYKSQIERVRAECELSLVSSMAQYNLLR